MGCIAGKTGHNDQSDTESTISTVSYREKSLAYDDNWTEQEIQEEKEIQEELEGKKNKTGTTKPVGNKKDPTRNSLNPASEVNKVHQVNNLKGELDNDVKADKIAEVNVDKSMENNHESKNDTQKVNTRKDTSKDDKIKGKEKAPEKNKPEDKKIDKDSVDGDVKVDTNNKVDNSDDQTDQRKQMSKENENMGNTESKVNVESKEKMDKTDEDKEKDNDELLDDHHVHWKDENKNKTEGVKLTPRDPGVKLMQTPSERVMSAHTRRGSLKHSAGKDRRLSLRFSASKERRGSTKLSASKERRASAISEDKDKKEKANEEQKMEDETNQPAENDETAESYADVEEMIQDETEKDEDEEDDIDSLNDDDISSSQMTYRAPSLSMWYDDNVQGDILTTQIYVPTFGLTRHTYYCCLQWNSGKNGGGYCGLQDHEHGRNYIFSIWDPLDGEGSIKPVYIGPGTTCEAFGGEGTGLKSWNFDLGWEPDCWYTLVTRRWDHEGHTHYGLWVKHHLECFWTHIVTVEFPLPGIYFDTWTCSFLEDWEGTGHRVRRAHMRNGFKRKLNGQWVPFDKAVLGMVKETASRRYRGNFDAGNFDEMFYLQSGGETIPTEGISEGSCFYSVSDDKPTEVPISCVLTTVTASEMVWEVSEGSVPQFRYAIKIDGELYRQEVNSEMRVCRFESPPQKLVEIFVEDILGRTANAKFVVREKLQHKYKTTYQKLAG